VLGVVKWLLIVLAVAGALEGWWWFSRPLLVRDLAGTLFLFKRAPDPRSAFNERVQSTFPVGLPEAKLRTALEGQGFSEFGERGSAMWLNMADGPFCGVSWVVFWKADVSGTVKEISGFAKRACL
jgi:hypothetical protein